MKLNQYHKSSENQRNINVRVADISDTDSIANLYVEFLWSYGHKSDIAATKSFISKLLHEPWVVFLVAKSKGEIIGFLGGSLNYSAISLQKAFTINDLFVHKSKRGFGVAKKLLIGIEDYARQNRIVKLYVEAADTANTVIKLYESTGFVMESNVMLKKILK